MNWSMPALKLTMGVGMLGQTAILSDILEPVLGIWVAIAILVLPVALLILVKPGEAIPAAWVVRAHGAAVGLYLALSVATLVAMAMRGFVASDGLMGLFVALGLLPCAAVLGAIVAGRYRDPS